MNAEHATTVACPYPGLRAFFVSERDWYFGRQAHVDAMLTRLESCRFLAVVGSSGSGKSSLVFAGLIPALREGQLAGSRRDADGNPAAWNVITFNPGNDPLAELAAAIVAAAANREDPHLGGYVRAALDGGDQGLIEALKIAGLLDERLETLVYADQFEELFRFSERSTRAAQERALRFARLFVAAAEQQNERLHILLSMRSEFIGECERYPGLPELVSRSQFLTPRLSRKQLEQSLSCPAQVAGWQVAADALTAILNDCGNSPDQLPLAQHVMRRMWMRAAGEGRMEMTLEDYTAVGGIRDALAIHGRELVEKLPKPDGSDVARMVFMALCEQREEGPLVRRLSSVEEMQAIAGEKSGLVPEVIATFGGDDPGFIREDDGSLDVRHEAILRQWPLIHEWRVREAESESWLRELAQAAKDHEMVPPRAELWQGHDLRGAEEWLRVEKPSEAWARRHGVRNWERCARFLAKSHDAAVEQERRRQDAEFAALQEKQSRERRRAILIGSIAGVSVITGIVMTALWRRASESQTTADRAAESRLKALTAFGETAAAIQPPMFASCKSAIAQAEDAKTRLLFGIQRGATDAPPDPAEAESFQRARTVAADAVNAVRSLAQSVVKAAESTGDESLKGASAGLDKQLKEVLSLDAKLQDTQPLLDAVNAAIESRLTKADGALSGLYGSQPLDPDFVKAKDGKILEATAHLDAIDGMQKTAAIAGIDLAQVKINPDLMARITAALNSARYVQQTKIAPGEVAPLELAKAQPLKHDGNVSRMRFAPLQHGKDWLLASATQAGKGGGALWCWTSRRKEPYLLSQGSGSAINDLAFSPKENALALASDGSTVRVIRWIATNEDFRLKTDAFQRHVDSITDVEFSQGGDRIASASADRTVRVFHSSTMEQLYFTSPPLPGIVTAVAFHRGGNLVVSGCDDGGVRRHSIPLPPDTKAFGKMDAPARRPEFSKDGKFVVAASADRTARVWRTEPIEEIAKVEHDAPVTQASFWPVEGSAGYRVITCATDGQVHVFRFTESTNAGEAVKKIPLDYRHPGAVASMAWAPDGRWFASVGAGEVLIWDWNEGSPVAVRRVKGLPREMARAEFSPDGKLMVVYGDHPMAYLWDLSQVSL